MGRGAEAPIGHQHLPLVYARMHHLHVSQVVGEEGRHHELQEHPGAGMNQP